MLMCALFYVPMLKKENTSSVLQKNYSKDCTVSSITKVPGVVQTVFSIYGFY